MIDVVCLICGNHVTTCIGYRYLIPLSTIFVSYIVTVSVNDGGKTVLRY